MVDTVKANEGVVSSIGDTDLVMVCASGGSLKPISFENLMKAVRGEIKIGGRNYAALSTATMMNATVEGSVLKQVVADTRASFQLQVTVFDSANKQTALYNKTIPQDGRYFVSVNVPDGTAILYVKHNGQARDFGARFAFPYSGQFLIGLTIKASSSLYEISDIMVERADVASDWTPAPEDIASGAWGGVIGLYTINYNSDKKGGAHESRLYDLNCAAEGCADSILSFRSLDALCEWLGRACEDGCDILDSEFRYNQGFGSGVADRVLSGRISIDGNTAGKYGSRCIDLLDVSELDTAFGLQHSGLLQGNSRRNLSAELHKGYVHGLVQAGVCIADRKEVAA